MRRRRVIAGAAVAALAGGAAAGLVLVGGDAEGAGPHTATTEHRTTAAVQRTDLAEYEELDGTLGYGASTPLSLGGPGTITALPAPGTVLDRGAVVAEVDGIGVPLFLGDRPLWRALHEGVGDGPDVRIVEENLTALGFANAGNLNVDEQFTPGTAAAIARWQRARGVEETGVLLPGQVVVRPTPVRVAAVTAAAGSPAGGPVVEVTGIDRRITLSIAARRQGLVATGDAVTVELPDGTRVPGRVAEVGTVINPGNEQQGTSASFDVVVALDDPAAAGTLDEAPVEVILTTTAADDVLAVPVAALLALAEGGYAVERVVGATTELVAVQIGAFADGLVQVEGDLVEGDEVVVPR